MSKLGTAGQVIGPISGVVVNGVMGLFAAAGVYSLGTTIADWAPALIYPKLIQDALFILQPVSAFLISTPYLIPLAITAYCVWGAYTHFKLWGNAGEKLSNGVSAVKSRFTRTAPA